MIAIGRIVRGIAGVLVFTAIIFTYSDGAPPTIQRSDSKDIPPAASDFVEVVDGDMPLLLTPGHGGWKNCGEKKNTGYSADALLAELHSLILARIYEKTGHTPYIVYNQANRNYVNPNRYPGNRELANKDNKLALSVYELFHREVDDVIGRLEKEFGLDSGLMINMHTADLSADGKNPMPYDRLCEIGILAGISRPESSRSSMASLFARKGAAAINGPDSIPYLIYHANAWPNKDAVWPKAAGKECRTAVLKGKDVWHVIPAKFGGKWQTARFCGTTTIAYHGTGKKGKNKKYAHDLDAFQIEHNYTSKTGFALSKDDPRRKSSTRPDVLNEELATAYLDVFVDAILHSLKVNYGWEPTKGRSIIVDNGSKGFVTKGEWEPSRGKGYWGTPSVYSDKKGDQAGWSATLPSTGKWEVAVRYSNSGSRANNVPFTVSYSGGSKTVRVDQTRGSGKWQVLGTFPFSKSKPARVLLICEGVADSTCADAVRFRLSE